MKKEFILGCFGRVDIQISPDPTAPPKIEFTAFEVVGERTILELKSIDKQLYETLLHVSKEMWSGKKLKVTIETIDESKS